MVPRPPELSSAFFPLPSGGIAARLPWGERGSRGCQPGTGPVGPRG